MKFGLEGLSEDLQWVPLPWHVKFVADIVVIPDYYLQGKAGFEGLEGVQRLYGIDLMALVSYDQVAHEDDNNWSLGYVTIVGAYVLKGTRHDISTLVDLAVVSSGCSLERCWPWEWPRRW